MNGFSYILIYIIAIVSSLLLGSNIAYLFLQRKKKIQQKKVRLNAAGITESEYISNFIIDGIALRILKYSVKISNSIYYVSNSFRLSAKLVHKKLLSQKIYELSLKANMPKIFNNYVYREVQLRLAIIFSLTLGFIGLVVSNMMTVMLFVTGIILGLMSVSWAMKKEMSVRRFDLEKSLPEMLEVVSLGLRSGLTFDRSLSIYTEHFHNNFSKACSLSQKKWESGVCSREEALRELSNSYDSYIFKRVVDNILRSLRFGSSLVEGLEESANEARNLYKTKQEEIVTKAPVKMMIPTGTLILPAMLILVLGPILLELTNGI